MTDQNQYHQIAEFLGQFTVDPLGFVYSVFPWGEGSLAEHSGPDMWSEKLLKKLGEDLRANIGKENQIIQEAVASGHGVGKSALVAWLILWATSTMVDTKGVVTANTEAQLRTKTWSELAKWYQLFIGKPLFKFTATSIYSADPDHEKTWRIDATPWSATNTEAYAGLHNEGRRLLLVFDEASAIDPKIWEVAEGALTDKATQIIWCAFGNPTRPNGKFYDCFYSNSKIWGTHRVDSRSVKITNKEQIAKWVETYGEDSDFVRVRVRGEFPRMAVNSFISAELLELCNNRNLEKRDYNYLRPVIGVDPARFGNDVSVILTRQGDKVHPPKRFVQLDLMELASKVLEEYRAYGSQGAICVDGVGIGAGLVDFLRHRGLPVVDIQSSAKALDLKTYANKRSELYGKCKEFLERGGCLPKDSELTEQLGAITYGYNNRLQIQLESKDDIRKVLGRSPDVSDAFAYTFAYEEAVQLAQRARARHIKRVAW